MVPRRALTCLLVFSTSLAASVATAEYQIAFGGFAPIDADVFIADANGGNARVLAPHPAIDQNASFSRDGQWVVFTSWRAGSADLYRVRSDGTGLERLTSDSSFDDQGAMSPDGEWIAFASDRGGIPR